MKAEEVWVGNSLTEQHQVVAGGEEGEVNHALWTADGVFLVATTRWSAVRLDEEGLVEMIGSWRPAPG